MGQGIDIVKKLGYSTAAGKGPWVFPQNDIPMFICDTGANKHLYFSPNNYTVAALFDNATQLVYLRHGSPECYSYTPEKNSYTVSGNTVTFKIAEGTSDKISVYNPLTGEESYITVDPTNMSLFGTTSGVDNSITSVTVNANNTLTVVSSGANFNSPVIIRNNRKTVNMTDRSKHAYGYLKSLGGFVYINPYKIGCESPDIGWWSDAFEYDIICGFVANAVKDLHVNVF